MLPLGRAADRACCPVSPGLGRVQVEKLPELAQWQLYLVDWGYNTPAERRQAAASERIRVVDIGEFERLAGVAQGAPAGT